MSVAEHETHAGYHDEQAAHHEAQYRPEARTPGKGPVQCLDQPLAGVPTSGGENIEVMKPCWTSVTNPTAHHLEQAKEHRELAARHRAVAKKLLNNEAEACTGLGEDAIAHSPFFHTEDVLGVSELRENSEVLGAVIRFRKVPGLTVDWMRRALACHQTRAAVMGYSTTFQPYCPVSVFGVAVSVTENGGEIVVSVRGKNADVGAVVFGRASDLLERKPSDLLERKP